MAPPQKFKFADGEKVLCFHGPLLYEAKTIKSEQKDKLIRYFVHYQGWNKSWDEWVPENRVLKFNDANIEKQKELVAASEAQKASKKKKISDDLASTPGSGRGSPVPQASGAKTSRAATSTAAADSGTKKKIKVEPSVETEIQYTKKCEIKIKIPDEIKSWLVDDWDFITRQKKLVRLPAQVNVDQILDSYIDAKKGTKLSEEQVVEVMSGIREYFNVMIGCQLLYKFERPQYQKLLKESEDSVNMSSVYGIIHLLRLFTKLGQVLVYTDIDEKEMPQLINHIHEFLKYIAKTPNLFSSSDYEASTPEYQRKTL